MKRAIVQAMFFFVFACVGSAAFIFGAMIFASLNSDKDDH